MRKDGKPKNNASYIPYQCFQEKTPQNSETKKQFSFESNSFGTELPKVYFKSFTETLAEGKRLVLRPHPVHFNAETVAPTLNQPS